MERQRTCVLRVCGVSISAVQAQALRREGSDIEYVRLPTSEVRRGCPCVLCDASAADAGTRDAPNNIIKLLLLY